MFSSCFSEALERDRFMGPEEAKKFGIIDEIVKERPDLKDENTDSDSSKNDNKKDK